MIDALHRFHFLHPWWLLALVLLPLGLWPLWRAGGGVRELSKLVDAELLPHLLHGRAASRGLPTALLAASWVLATLAFAGPTWSRAQQPMYSEHAPQVIALSLSQRMLARDVAPSRLDRAKYKARDLLQSNGDGQNGLIGYAGEAFVVAPLTSDAASLGSLLDALAPDTMPIDGDNAADAIAQGVKLIANAGAGGGSLVLITDRSGPGARAAAAKARGAGVRVSVLGVGTQAGGPVPLAGGGFLRNSQGQVELAKRDDSALAALAAAGGGRYVPMSNDRSDIDALHALLKHAGSLAKGTQRSQQWQDRGPWLLLPLLPLVALAFRRGWLLIALIALLPMMPGTARADGWRDLWQRADQQAAQALQRGDPATAQKLARDPAWRGAAAYRAGHYATAEQALRPLTGSDAQYNLGNALARQGRYQQAIAAYDRALAQNPANADARANRKAVQDWLKQQQKKQQGKRNGDKGRDGQKNPQAGTSSSAGKPGDQSDKGQPGKNGQSQPTKGNDEASKGAGEKKSGDQQQKSDRENGTDTPQTPQQRAAEQARAEQARQALKQQMDKALAQKQAASGKDRHAPHQLGLPDANDPSSRLPADLRQALRRVPDDPGALLRRKFELEYQQRHGARPQEDGQP